MYSVEKKPNLAKGVSKRITSGNVTLRELLTSAVCAHQLVRLDNSAPVTNNTGTKHQCTAMKFP